MCWSCVVWSPEVWHSKWCINQRYLEQIEVDKKAWNLVLVFWYSPEVMRLTAWTTDALNHPSTQHCLVKPTRWVGVTQFISLLCVTSPWRHSSCRRSRTRSGAFHQDLHVRITQGVYVCLYMCEVSVRQSSNMFNETPAFTQDKAFRKVSGSSKVQFEIISGCLLSSVNSLKIGNKKWL